MRYPTPAANSGGSPQQSRSVAKEQLVAKQKLDDWLDEALAETFPASDPVASPPGTARSVAAAVAHERDRRRRPASIPS